MSRIPPALLTRRPHEDRPGQPVLEGIELTLGRVHELCGPARRTLAVMVAARTTGPVFWILPAWQKERLNPQGMVQFVDPARFTFVEAPRAEDLLWSAEECLRAGVVPLVVTDLPDPPGLTPVRRLHLAAEAGGEDGRMLPLGLLLTPGDGGAPGVESRWCMAPAHGPDTTEWSLSRTRARTAPVQDWQVVAGREGLRAVRMGG